MAQLNGYTNSEGVFVDVPLRPTDPYDPNGIARITPAYSRPDAKLAYKAWVDGYKGTKEETLFSGIADGTGAWTGGTYITLTAGTTLGYIWFTHDAVGSDPAPALHTEFGQVDVKTTDTGADVAEKLYKVLYGVYNTQASYVHSSTQVAVTNVTPASVADATAGTVGAVITVAVTEQGVDPVTTPWNGQYTDGDGAQNLNYR